MQTEETRSWKEKIDPVFDKLTSEVEPQINKSVCSLIIIHGQDALQ